MALSSEEEIIYLFINTQTIILLWSVLMDMGYPQPPTTVQTDNSMEYVFENKILKQVPVI